MAEAPLSGPVAQSGASGGGMQRALVAIPAFGALAGTLVALRIAERGEIWLDRTYWLVAIAAFGGLTGAALTRLVLARGWYPSWLYPRLFAAIAFACFFMAGMMLAYVFQYMVISGQFEPNPERPVRGVIFGFLQIAALFLISCPAYLLPWPLPALTMVAGWLLAPATPADAAKPVEPGGDGV